MTFDVISWTKSLKSAFSYQKLIRSITFCLSLHIIQYFFMEKQGYNNRIRVILADRQVTNRTLADMLGVSPMTVSRWVTNRYQPSMSQFVEISKMLNVDIRELIDVDPLEISGDVKTETSARKQYPPLEN